MQRIQIINTKKNINKEVKLCGWVHFKRNLGKITFITLRDAS
ncbi:MAG TPA: OB-fold nucleic acid binding domain-containing protein, partial [Patescibacteria group bacterium]|nr:OB-fold nucleic acid binding domain-containing protein [Patescibacteria group bacterium]